MLKLGDLRRMHREMSFHPIDGGAVVYDPTGKRLFALNAAAALVWIAIRDGRTVASGDSSVAGGAQSLSLPLKTASRPSMPNRRADGHTRNHAAQPA